MKKKIVVAMSGGVDSSVTAALLKKEGYEVVGVTLRLFSERRDAVKCCGGADSAAKARASAQAIGIRHYFKSAQGLFSKAVIGDFVSGYLAGSTPNPCVECNRHLKFSYLFDLARSMGAEYLATGHYAVIKKEEGEYGLYRGADPLKDQSYFLYCLKKQQLGRLLFPLGGLTKKEVRRLAAEFSLPTASEPESNDICFVTEGNYDLYLKKTAGIKPKPGYILDLAGRRIGRHNGFFNFTVGQRRGTGVYGGARLYVTEIRPETNEVVLGPLEAAHSSAFAVRDVNWLAAPAAAEFQSAVQIRYRHKPAACAVRLSGSGAGVSLAKPQFAVAPGQSAVFYSGDRVLGGGIITNSKIKGGGE
ncbi:MAG: tRNA 2-thiouridine(34) synthase MnmA [Elusimicrobia bacterium GWA2_61_42]|nr:MAG: tRNA 2-thiouridine(34) synthase MnmA [Elusimicrobia bacterium GWA2_61_42]OGR76369.1 MAG: tRNA 2-thiouridine(34) synthase MnmA [Elusimicrobia bacterium GWC2_61_25]